MLGSLIHAAWQNPAAVELCNVTLQQHDSAVRDALLLLCYTPSGPKHGVLYCDSC